MFNVSLNLGLWPHSDFYPCIFRVSLVKIGIWPKIGLWPLNFIEEVLIPVQIWSKNEREKWRIKIKNKKNYQQRNKRGKVKKQSEVAHGFMK